jgi:CubicO group peptidase (beta-lactamase class C family)
LSRLHQTCNMIKSFLLPFVFILSFINTSAQALKNESAVDDFIKEQLNQKNIAGAVVLVAHKGNNILHRAYGYQDIDNKMVMDTSSIFRIHSMTKPITSLATMILVDRNSINLDDPIEKYIPELKNLMVLKGKKLVKSTGKITIKDLLRHTSGFAYGAGLGNSKVDKLYDEKHPLFVSNSDQMIQRLSELPLQNNPGKKYNYSLSADVLGCIIERVSGLSLVAFFKKNIFEPLAMDDTHFKLPQSKISRFCSYYEHNLKLKESYKSTDYLKDRMQQGGGGLISTSSDYLKFCKLILNKGIHNNDTLISSSLIAQMTSNQLPKGEGVYKLNDEIGIGFGLGFMVFMKEWGNQGHKGDYGWNGIGGTHFYVSPKDELIVIIMSQKSPYSNKLVDGLKPIIFEGL